MKFTRFIVYLLLKSHKIVPAPTNFIDFLSVNFWTQNVPIPTYHILPPSTNFYLFLPTFTNFYHLPSNFTTFHRFLPILPLPTFTTFHQLLPNFTTSYQFLYHFYQFYVFHLLPSFIFIYLPPILTNFTLLFTTFHQFCDTNAFSKYYLQIKFITIFYSASNQYHNINITWQFIICFNQYFSIMKFSNAYYLFNFV